MPLLGEARGHWPHHDTKGVKKPDFIGVSNDEI